MVKVLIADDSAGVRRVLSQCLSGEGRRMLTAEDGDSALFMARAHLPDLIILDVRMPGRSGYEVFAALRGDALTSAIPILMLSGIGDGDRAESSDGCGADAYVAKPFNLTALQERVSSLLGARVSMP